MLPSVLYMYYENLSIFTCSRENKVFVRGVHTAVQHLAGWHQAIRSKVKVTVTPQNTFWPMAKKVFTDYYLARVEK